MLHHLPSELDLLCTSIALRKEVHKDFREKFFIYKKCISQILILACHFPEVNGLHCKEQEGMTDICILFLAVAGLPRATSFPFSGPHLLECLDFEASQIRDW